jgi:hypothetical protein
MAIVTSFSGINMFAADFNRMYLGGYDSGISYNMSYNGITYQSVFDVEWTHQNSDFISLFGGKGITYTYNPLYGNVITGGTVTGYMQLSDNGKTVTPNFSIEGISVSATKFYDAARTVTETDDRGILLEALSGNDLLIGSSTEDCMFGGWGNDIFYAGGGNDSILDSVNGSGSIDTIVLAGKRSDYSVAINAASDSTKTIDVNIYDKVDNRDGHDILTNIERIEFSDFKVAVDINGNAGQAYRLYTAALGRLPDVDGLSGWIKFKDDGGSLNTMAQQFVDSQEFKVKYGQLDDRGFVDLLYMNVLGRHGEAAGVNGWVNGIANGVSRADVLVGFSESAENQANVYKFIKDGIVINEWWLS